MTLVTADAALIAAAIMGGTAYDWPATVYLELVSSTPTASAAGTASGLGRIAVTSATFWTDNADGTLSSAEIAAWEAATSDIGEVTYVEVWDAASSGNRKAFGALTGTSAERTIVTGQIARFPAGDLTVTVA